MKARRLVSWLLAVALAAAWVVPLPGPVAAQDACPGPSASERPGPREPLVMPEDYRISLFDATWGAVDRLYLDPGFNGIDWQAVNAEYAPWVLQTENAYEVYALLEEMVALLGDPYTLFLSPAFIEAASSEGRPFGGIGALLDSRAGEIEGLGLRILYVFPGSPADGAGLRARDRIVAVNGDPCVRIADIRGPVGTPVRLTVVSPGEEPRDITIQRGTVDPRIQPEARRLAAAPGVGYLRLPSLAGQETIDAATDALTGMLEEGSLDALLIDVRRTSAGAPGVVTSLLGHFVAGQVGTLYARDDSSPLAISKGSLLAVLEGVPVIVLVDELTEGPAEQLAAVLQDQGRARVVGVQTIGRTQGVESVDFPDGSAVQVVAYGLELSDGRRLEETGVSPDVEVVADWLDFPESADPFILAALEVLDAGPDVASPSPSAAAASPLPEASG